MPSEDEEAAVLVARLNQIRRLESRSESSSSETSLPTDISFPTPSIPSYAQVAARASTPSPRVRVMARGPAPSQQRTSRGQRGAGSQARRMGARVPAVSAGVRDGAELLPTSTPRRAETPPPLGFNYNRGANYVPFVITTQGRSVPARFTRVVMGADPHVIGMIPGDNNQYGAPYTLPQTMTRKTDLGTPLTTYGSSRLELTTPLASTSPSTSSTTYPSRPRSRASGKPRACSPNTRKTSARSRCTCGRRGR